MMFKSSLVMALLATGSDAFVVNPSASTFKTSAESMVVLEMANGKKRAVVKKVATKAAKAVGAIALTGAVIPQAAFAAKKVIETVEVVDNTKKIMDIVPYVAGAAVAAVAGYKFVGAGAGANEQDFLEFDPYYDHSEVKVNTYKNKAPFTGKVVSTKRIVGPKATGETCHIVIDHEGNFPYIEGQSWGVIPPGINEKNGKPHNVRLYSIASSRYGDDMTGKTGSLCVRRATYWCPELKADDPTKKGICSNFLCDTQPGDEVMMTGPAGKVMLMPEQDPNTDYIMVATGTGIAPYRGFVRRLFTEKTPAAKAYKGTAWLFLGVANSDALLYDDEWQEVKKNYPDNFRLDYALSREQNNKKGGKMYIQDKVEEYADEIFSKLDNGAHIYFCGLKGMMPGIQDMLKAVCTSKGIDFDEWLKGLKGKKQWHVEVY